MWCLGGNKRSSLPQPAPRETISFEAVMALKEGRKLFQDHMKSERNYEVYEFLEDLEQFKLRKSAKLAKDIFLKYFKEGTAKELNVSEQTRAAVQQEFRRTNQLEISNLAVSIKVFDKAEEMLLVEIKEDVFPRFIKSAKWLSFVEGKNERYLERITKKRSMSTQLSSPPVRSTTLDFDAAEPRVSLTGELGKKYKLLLAMIATEPRFVKALAEAVPQNYQDPLADAIFVLAQQLGGSACVLNLIDKFVEIEFARKHMHPYTILRVNTLVTKLIGRYSNKLGHEFIKTLLLDLVDSVFVEERRKSLSGNVQTENMQEIEQICQCFVDKITSQEMLAQVPRELRAICRAIQQNGEKFSLDFEKAILPLLSGFIMLRLICPAIILPHVYGVHKSEPSGSTRKKLTLITKIIQKLANGEVFSENLGSDLVSMNKFIERNQQKLKNFLVAVCKDPRFEIQEVQEPFKDLQQKVSLEDVHIKEFDLPSLRFLHNIIFQFGYQIGVSLQQEVIHTKNKRPVSIVCSNSSFLELIMEMGPPTSDAPQAKTVPAAEFTNKKKPVRRSSVVVGAPSSPLSPTTSPTKFGFNKHKEVSVFTKLKKGDLIDKNEAKLETFLGKNYEQIKQSITRKNMENLLLHSQQFDLSNLDQLKFIYTSAIASVPTVYLILHRIPIEILQEMDKLMVYVFKTISFLLSSSFHVVIDFSFFNLTEELHASMYTVAVTFLAMMSEEYLSNCRTIYMVHPSHKNTKLLKDIEHLVQDAFPVSVQICIIPCYQSLPNEELPRISKKVLPCWYGLLSKRHNQRKYLKIASSSLIIIFRKTKQVNREIAFHDIEEIRSHKDSNSVYIRLSEKYGIKSKSYTFASQQEKQDFLHEVTAALVGLKIKPKTEALELQFLTSANDDATLRITTDSVLLFQKHKNGRFTVLQEIGFPAVSGSFVDSANENSLVIQHFVPKVTQSSPTSSSKASFDFGANAHLNFSTHHAAAIRNSLIENLLVFENEMDYIKRQDDIKSLFKNKTHYDVMERFFNAPKLKAARRKSAAQLAEEEADNNKWEKIIRLNAIHTDMKKLFKLLTSQQTQEGNMLENQKKYVTLDTVTSLLQGHARVSLKLITSVVASEIAQESPSAATSTPSPRAGTSPSGTCMISEITSSPSSQPPSPRDPMITPLPTTPLSDDGQVVIAFLDSECENKTMYFENIVMSWIHFQIIKQQHSFISNTKAPSSPK